MAVGVFTAPPGAATHQPKTLILYDTSGDHGWLGELYAMYAGNLVSHFGPYTAHPVATYAPGEIDGFAAAIYIGSTFDEQLPTALLDDVLDTTKPVIWIYDNVWQLAARRPGFFEAYGWEWWQFEREPVRTVIYKNTSLTRSVLNDGGIMKYGRVDASIATVLAEAVRDDGARFPWALRSKNLTYIGEVPFAYTSETDRVLIFADLLFDALAPGTGVRHRALVRLEDIHPRTEPLHLKGFANYFALKKIKFGFGVSPVYMDPLGALNGGVPKTLTLSSNPALIDAIKVMRRKGGVLVEHGYTHQYSNVANPYNGVTGDDYEFLRVVEDPDHTLNYVGPVPEDSVTWVRDRIDASNREFGSAGFATPTIFEFPHYAASATAYQTVSSMFTKRWERGIYYAGLLSGLPIDHSRSIGQFFPYVVRDVYGSNVLPENIGNFEPEPFYQYPTHTVEDILAAARANLVVRDGFASFYYHNDFGLASMKRIVEGLQDLGYSFADPRAL